MSPPKQPPRPGSLPTITEEGEPGAAFREFRETSFGERPTVPPSFRREAPQEDNPPMARPRDRQPSQRDIDQPPRSSHVDIEIDTEVLSDADTAKTFRPGIRPWVAIIGVAITAAASVVSTYMLTHATPADCASKGDMNAAQKSISDLTTTVNNLPAAMAKNADTAHNETSELRNTVNRNADRTEQTLGRLNDKLDLFMKR